MGNESMLPSSVWYARPPSICCHPSKPGLENHDVLQTALFSLLYLDFVLTSLTLGLMAFFIS